jgi:hypothetical protein
MMTWIEVLMTWHKTPIDPRPLDRVGNSQIKVYYELVASMLTQVLDDIEDEWVNKERKQ